MSQPRGLGYRPSPPKLPGERPDFDARTKLRAGPAPVRSDNSNQLPDLPEQSFQGACVAHAVMTAVRGSQIRLGAPHAPLGSRAWTYYLARSYTGEQNEDNGTYIRNAFAAIVKFGFPPESAFPYDPREYKRMPTADVFRQAYDQRAPTEYHRILTTGRARVDDVKRALGQGFLVCFGTLVSDRFCNNDLGDGPIQPPIGESIAGGHALLAADHDGDVFRCPNWWGRDWGDDGYCYLSADYIAWAETQDAWLVEAAPPFSSEVA